MKKKIKQLFGKSGIIETNNSKGNEQYNLHNYINDNGEFNYEEYRRIQTEGNKKKIDTVWVIEENIEFLANYIKKEVPNLKFGLCHGTRRGKEQEWFNKYLGIDVIGTEISDTATQFPNTIQWDFHNVKTEWIDSVDFIYSNSFDHSYDPKNCLKNWMSCLKNGGVCILEHSDGHVESTELDPFGAQLQIMPYLILEWGMGEFSAREILNAPSKSQWRKYIKYIIIKRN